MVSSLKCEAKSLRPPERPLIENSVEGKRIMIADAPVQSKRTRSHCVCSCDIFWSCGKGMGIGKGEKLGTII